MGTLQPSSDLRHKDRDQAELVANLDGDYMNPTPYTSFSWPVYPTVCNTVLMT